MLQRLRIGKEGRHIVRRDGTEFVWLGDTAWELFHCLTREETEEYLTARGQQGFNVIQAVALAEFDGIRTPNAYGRLPLRQNEDGRFDPRYPDTSTDDGSYTYWDHVDFVIQKAAERSLYVGFLPTWGDKYHQAWGKGPELFTPENAYAYGRWLGERYRDYPNIVWILGGDRALATAQHFAVIQSIAAGLGEGDGHGHLLTFHPQGGSSSAYHVHDEPWLDFNMIQSGHGRLHMENYRMVAADYQRAPAKPTMDAEPCYEDHPVGFKPDNGYFDAVDVRRAAYWALFSGACGHTYGHHSIWSMTTEPGDYFIMTWREALGRPGAEQMQHARRLMESRPLQGSRPQQNALVRPYAGVNYTAVLRGPSYWYVYSPNGLAFALHWSQGQGEPARAHWYNPRNGERLTAHGTAGDEKLHFCPPSSGRGQDWVLVVDELV